MYEKFEDTKGVNKIRRRSDNTMAKKAKQCLTKYYMTSTSFEEYSKVFRTSNSVGRQLEMTSVCRDIYKQINRKVLILTV
jgi:hypothetical protein